MNKTSIVQSILEAIRADFEKFQSASRSTRSAGNDAESRAEDKYDTRSTEENYLADGLARQAASLVQTAAAYEAMTLRPFDETSPIDLGALIQLQYPKETMWFFLGPAGGGLEVESDGQAVMVLTPESPLGRQLMGLRCGGKTQAPKTKVLRVL